MKVGILGLPSSGKTTLFNLLTGASADTTPFSSGKGEVHLGAVQVPDNRVEKIAAHYASKKATHAEISFVDLAGVPGSGARGAVKAEDLIPHLRDADALALVLRDFESETAPAPGGRVDPAVDLDEIHADLLLSDLAVAEKKLSHLEKEKKGKDPAKVHEYELLSKVKACLDSEKRLASLPFDEEEERLLSGYGFLTMKGVIPLRNFGEGGSADPSAELARKAAALGVPLLSMNALLECEVRELPEEERASFYETFGIEGKGRSRFIHAAYEALHLITFFTAAPTEARAWAIRQGTAAVKAAGKVHTDMEKGFIRAEVIPYETLVELGGVKQAKEAGRMRLEGKEYVVTDGDILQIRFSP